MLRRGGRGGGSGFRREDIGGKYIELGVDGDIARGETDSLGVTTVSCSCSIKAAICRFSISAQVASSKALIYIHICI